MDPSMHDFIQPCLTVDPENQPMSKKLLPLEWLQSWITTRHKKVAPNHELNPNVALALEAFHN